MHARKTGCTSEVLHPRAQPISRRCENCPDLYIYIDIYIDIYIYIYIDIYIYIYI